MTTSVTLNRLHHLNLLVRDLDSAVHEWTRFLGSDPLVEPLPSRGVKTARFALGPTWLVLVEPTDPEGAPGQYMTAHGEGVFLLSFGTSDLEDARDSLASREISVQDVPRQGVAGWTVLDVTPDPASGLLRQLCQDAAGA